MEETKSGRAPFGGIDALGLKFLAMALMLCDHTWYAFFQDAAPGWRIMTYAGRLAFPIFAFQIAEGFAHTRSFKCYWRRMFFFALVSEIPFNLMVYGTPLSLSYQNVMFSFCISLPLLALIEHARKRGRATYVLAAAACIAIGYMAGYFAQVDYYGEGILTVLMF